MHKFLLFAALTISAVSAIEARPVIASPEQLQAKAVSGSVSVKVTRKGETISGETVFLLQWLAQGCTEFKTKSDKAGIALFSDLKPADYIVLSQRDRNWVGNLKDPELRNRLNCLPKINLGQGKQESLTLDLFDSARAWLTIKPVSTKGLTLQRAQLWRDGNSFRFNSDIQLSGSGLYEFGPVGIGEYRLKVSFQSEPGSKEEAYWAWIKVEKTDDVLCEVSFARFMVEGVAKGFEKYIKGKPMRSATVMLRPSLLDPRDESERTKFVRRATLDEKGKFSFANVVEGEYDLVVGVSDGNLFPFVKTGQRVVVSKNLNNLALSIPDKCGNIAVQIEKVAVKNSYLQLMSLTLHVFDAAGKAIPAPDPADALVFDRSAAFRSIPPGTYSLELRGRGFATIRTERVEVKADETTVITLPWPDPAEVQVEISGLDIPKLSGQPLIVRYLGADGKPLEPLECSMPVFEFMAAGGSLSGVLEGVPGTAKSILISMHGYEEITFLVKPGQPQGQHESFKAKPKD